MARPQKNTVDYFPFYCEDGKKMYYLEVYANDENEINIEIESPHLEGSFVSFNSDRYISLDVDTAIKFSKQLRKSIAKVKEADDV